LIQGSNQHGDRYELRSVDPPRHRNQPRQTVRGSQGAPRPTPADPDPLMPRSQALMGAFIVAVVAASVCAVIGFVAGMAAG